MKRYLVSAYFARGWLRMEKTADVVIIEAGSSE